MDSRFLPSKSRTVSLLNVLKATVPLNFDLVQPEGATLEESSFPRQEMDSRALPVQFEVARTIGECVHSLTEFSSMCSTAERHCNGLHFRCTSSRRRYSFPRTRLIPDHCSSNRCCQFHRRVCLPAKCRRLAQFRTRTTERGTGRVSTSSVRRLRSDVRHCGSWCDVLHDSGALRVRRQNSFPDKRWTPDHSPSSLRHSSRQR